MYIMLVKMGVELTVNARIDETEEKNTKEQRLVCRLRKLEQALARKDRQMDELTQGLREINVGVSRRHGALVIDTSQFNNQSRRPHELGLQPMMK